MDFEICDIVISNSGRDRGKYFAVVGIENENFVLIADGKYRKLEKPKLKRKKHLKATGLKLNALKEKCNNKEFYKSLEAVLNEQDQM